MRLLLSRRPLAGRPLAANKNRRLAASATAFAALLLFTTSSFAQTISWTEDFQGPVTNWVGDARTAPDPTSNGNIVYGVRQPSSRQRAVGRSGPGERPDAGSHATLTSRWFTVARGFEYRGRFFRATGASSIGLTFFSQQPEGTNEYLLAMWRGSMRLFGPDLDADSGFVPQAGRWHRFAIRADEEGSAIRIRARFWLDGQNEPEGWSLDVSDRTTSRLAGGRVGIWVGGGAAYVDDLAVAGDTVQNADHTPPAITFSESGRDLVTSAGATNAFNRDVRLDVRAVDGSGIASLTITRNGAAFKSGDVIAIEGSHELEARATDTAGNEAVAKIALLIDKTPPVITIRHGGQVLISNALFAGAVKPEITVDDLTATTVIATLNGQPFTPGTTISDERAHALIVTATDALGWTTTTTPILFTIDRTAPAIAFLESGRLLQPGARNVLDHDARVHVQIADATATVALTVDGQPYVAGAPITGEGTHVIRARVTDAAGNGTDAEVLIVIDKTRPVITVSPIPSLTNQVVRPVIDVQDATATTITATLDDAPFTSGSAIDTERRHTLTVSATDEAGWTTTLAPIVFTIDRTPPAIAFVTPAANAMLSAPRLTATGDAGDAQRVVVNGVNATIDAQTFTVIVDLSEGSNTLTAIATDTAGNESTATLAVRLDTRAPLLTVTSPTANACLDATQIELRGTVSDASGATIRVCRTDTLVCPPPGQTGVSVLHGNTWTATLPVPTEGRVVFTIEATDAAGHTTQTSLPLTIDRTPPTLALTESGAPLTDLVSNRSLAIFGRAVDADPSATVAMTLDAQPYVSGTPVSSEKAYVLTAVATDCAGHTSETRTVRFTIDRTPPVISALTPASGATVGTRPPLTGHVSEEASVSIEGTGERATFTGLDFALDAPLSEGLNQLVLIARDKAGNESRVAHAFTIRTKTPSIEITENGTAIAADALFNRIVTPVIRTNDPSATIAATLDGQPFISGTAVSADGRHTINATVTDVVSHTATASAVFTVDRTPPRITITSPAPGAALTGATVEVRGSADDDATRVIINGVTATLTGTNWTAAIPIDFGPTPILATAFDRAGNAGSAEVEVTRGAERIGILLTSPADGSLTNRPTTVVSGQVLTPSAARSVTINGVELPTDAAGAFLKTDLALSEGDNAITAATAPIGATSLNGSVTVHVFADFTPPTLRVIADGAELTEGARFITSPTISVEATDPSAAAGASPAVSRLTIDGTLITSNAVLAAGGHALTAIARDAAGNESRLDRTFFVGQTTAALGCSITGVDPADGSSLFGEHVRLTGRANAEALLINGVRASVADGTFCGDATLAPGRNEIVLQCARADGTPTAEPPVTIVIHRWLDPEIAITSPANGTVITTSRITVTGTVGAGVVSGDVNGLPMTLVGSAFTVSDVAVSPGLNVIAARARTSSERMSVATVRVIARTGVPQIAITSPLAGTQTGAAAIDVTGTFANVDPATIAIGNASVTTTSSGTFSATVMLAGSTTITATARSLAGVIVSASVDVTRVADAPSIVIAAPSDNTFVRSSTDTLRVTGTFAAGDGAQISVNGVPAETSGSSFTADVDLVASGMTPIVARVTEADGRSSTDAARVTRYAAPLAVKETFPAANAAEVDRGIAIVLLFNNVLDAASAGDAIRVSDAANAPIAGELFVDRDAVTFAPHAPLRAGERYTVTIGTALRDQSAATLAVAHAFGFMAAASAPATPPVVDQSDAAGCITSQTITGRTSVPGARVRLDVDGVSTTTIANAANAFTFNFTLSGQPGYHAVRVREIGSDGTLSPERALCLRINCAAPQVLGATLDRAARKLVVTFSKPMDAATLTLGTSIVLEPAVAASVSVSGEIATITLDADVTNVTLKMIVTTAARAIGGVALISDYTETFAPGSAPGVGRGQGFLSGAVYDATNGRPLPGAQVTIGDELVTTDARGRYSRAVAEGAYTIRAAAGEAPDAPQGAPRGAAPASGAGFSTVWRQVIVPAGAGVIPIDIRLTKRGPEHIANGAPATLTHGGDSSVTKAVSLSLAAASLPNGRSIRVTSVGAQSLAGLLPLGWSPLAAAEIVVDGSDTIVPLPGARLTFDVAANPALSLVSYDDARDEWRVEVAIANATSFDLAQSGNYALVYPDSAPHLAHPPAARAGAALAGVVDPCASDAACRLTGRSFTLLPKAVVPSGRSVATLVTEGALQAYPSGTAVQAFIDEQLNLADGRVLVEPPFATDLLVYRNLAGDAGVADFHLAPSAQAATVLLRDGVEQIRIVDYPGRIARGTLVGAEGGRLPGGDGVTIDVPAGATFEPLHATVAPLSAADLAAFGTIAGFRIAGGFALTLTRATTPAPIEDVTLAPPSLLKPARATVNVTGPGTQVVIAEVLTNTPFGTLVRLASLMSSANTRLFTTRDAAPLEGIVRDGRYLVLVADAPIAFAHGQVRGGDASGPAVANARVTANALGVTDLTRASGLFVVPVLAKPAAPFSLTPRTVATGDGATRVHPSSPEPDAMIDVGALPLAAQAPRLVDVTPPNDAAIDATAAFLVQARFDLAIDPSSVAGGVTVINRTNGAALAGSVSAAGSIVSFNASAPLVPAATYSISIAPTIRGANGAPFGRTHVTSFTTRAIPAGNTAIRPERLRITIPDDTGHVTISGLAGALPGGAQAIAVRRNRLFVVSYTATVASDGSFTFTAGHGDQRDAIGLTDAIDLQVLDSVSRAIVAMIPLTPFSTADGRGFVAPPDVATRFTSPEGVVVSVPAGAFEVPTLITIGTAAQSDFAVVPGFADELSFAAAVRLTFNGIARKPLELDLPIPAGVTTANRTFLLGRLAMSARGPRVEIDDLLRVDGNVFTTRAAPAPPPVRAMATTAGTPVGALVPRIFHSGPYAAIEIKTPFDWAVMRGLEEGADVLLDAFRSLFFSSSAIQFGGGVVVIPVLRDRPFVVEGVDADTGLTTFTTSYAALPAAEAGFGSAIESPLPNAMGPYPVFGSPVEIETLDLSIANTNLTSVRGFTVRLEGGVASVTRIGATPKTFTALNAVTGQSETTSDAEVRLDAAIGHRLVILASVEESEPTRVVEVVFSEPIAAATLSDVIHLEQNQSATTTPAWRRVDALADYDLGSGGRRVRLTLSNELQRGGEYQLVLDAAITDRAASPRGLVGGPLYLPFKIRSPRGDVLGQPLRVPKGGIRDLALDGNVLFVSALEGGLYAYDASDPAALLDRPPMSRAAVFPENHERPGQSWAVTVDHHGRVWNTALTDLFGVVRSFRLENFLHTAGGTASVSPTATSVVSWRTGVNIGLPLGTSYTLDSDRAEGVPRKLQIAVQDEWLDLRGGADFDTALAPNATNALDATALAGGTHGDFRTYGVTVAKSRDHPYRLQRVTIENRTLGLRWSGDIRLDTESGVTIPNVLVRTGDLIRISRNVSTYGVIALFGFGVGLYDLNALESNHLAGSPAPFGHRKPAEQIAMTEARTTSPCSDSSAPAGLPCLPDALTWVADATLVTSSLDGDAPSIHILGLEAKKGAVDVVVTPVPEAFESTPVASRGARIERDSGIAFTGSYSCPGGICHVDHPRLAAIRAKFTQAGRALSGRFANIARYDVARTCTDETNRPYACDASYGLVAANQFGILVLDLDEQLSPASLVDIIWVPAGASAVRVLTGSRLATAVDGHGRSLLIDLSRIDERDTVGMLEECATAPCIAELFPTARRALASGPVPGDAIAFGSDDPRIIWKSEPSDSIGVLAPVGDPDTGFLFQGDLLQQTMRVLAGSDPRIVVRANLGEGLQTIRTIVPMGIAPPKDVLKCIPASAGCEASLSAFRLETSLPAGIPAFDVAVESERLPGVETEQTREPLPRAHLRTVSRGALAELRPQRVRLEPVIPAALLAQMPMLHLQRGANRFQSPWIVALADPRAAKQFDWNGATGVEQSAAGCYFCTRPPSLRNDASVPEILTAGRFIAIRPESDPFAGTRYAYLAEAHRLEGRVSTYTAEAIHPPSVAVAAQNPPIADGMLQETTYLHSGELEASAIDLDAGGRAGWNVVIDRTLRSRTIGAGELGYGWTSSMFARLRELPNRNVEYRDAAGEVWLFTPSDAAAYVAPPGLPLRLTRNDRGWSLMDMKRRFTFFDTLGRLKARVDHFGDARETDLGTARGNVIRYLYDAAGRLAEIVDPVGRTTKLTYWSESERAQRGALPGRLREIVDWRGRRVTYGYDALGRLTTVRLPDAGAAVDGYAHLADERPRIEYAYQDIAGATPNDAIELAGNLTSITDPGEVVARRPRVEFRYGARDGAQRDHVVEQVWPCASYVIACASRTAEFHYERTPLETTDILGQKREYSLANRADGRMHVGVVTAVGVPVIQAVTAAPDLAPQPMSLATVIDGYDAHGQIEKVILPGGAILTNDYDPAESSPLGRLGASVFGAGDDHVQTVYHYEPAITLDTIVTEVGRQHASQLTATIPEPAFRDAQSPSRLRDKVVSRDKHADVATQSVTRVNAFGQPEWSEQLESNAAIQTGAEPNDDAARLQRTTYKQAGAAEIERGRPSDVKSGALASTITYAKSEHGGQTITVVDSRGVETIERLDAYDRPIERIVRKTAGGAEVSKELFGYDAGGRLAFTSTTRAPLGTVTTTTTYDALGRVRETKTNKRMKVDGADEALVVRNQYNLATRTVTTFDPTVGDAPAARTETVIDGLGRTQRVTRVGTSGSTVQRVFGYDLRGNLCYESDTVREATLRIFDALGREQTTIGSDGVRVVRQWSPWGELLEETVFDAAGHLTAKTASAYSGNGMLVRSSEQVEDTGRTRATARYFGNGGSRMRTGVGQVASLDAPMTGARVTDTLIDATGRTTLTRSGELGFTAPLAGLAVYTETAIDPEGFEGALPRNVTTREPRAGKEYATTTQYDALGRVIGTIEPGGYETVIDYDEPGNGVSVKRPGEAMSVAHHDGRGLVYEQTLQDGSSSKRFQYDALGNLREYRDEEDRATTYEVDDLGRPTKTIYPDGTAPSERTTEETRYEAVTGRMRAQRDRTGLWLWLDYDAGGRVRAIRTAGREAEPEPNAERRPELVRYTYDVAGRLTESRNADAARQYEQYDLLGRPRLTRQLRFRAASGLSAASQLLDVHTQGHVWSVFDGERLRWRMPIAGTALPETEASNSTWRRWIDEERESGDLLTQRAVAGPSGPAAGALLTETTWRGPGRARERKRYGATAAVTSTFGFDDASGLLRRVETESGTTLVGSEIRRTLSRRIEQELDLSLGDRRSVFAYDARQRLLGARLQRHETTPAGTSETLTLADFRAGRAIVPPSVDDEIARLANAPSNWTAAQNTSHQIESRTLTRDPSTSHTYGFAGGRRITSDGWSAHYDDLGRLVKMEKDAERIEYAYDPNGRLVGRTASSAVDALPKEVTFVWDDVTDRLVAMFDAGASTATLPTAPTPNAGLLRQYLHGDRAYDDPLVIQAAGKTYFPLIDETATGNLTAVLDEAGHMVERILYADAYGDAPRYLHGAVADRIDIEATKTATGEIASIEIRAHFSERIDPATLATGAHLTAVDPTNAITFRSPAIPTISSDYTLVWTLSASDWHALTTAPNTHALEIALTSTLRFAGWPTQPLTPAPEWTTHLFHSASSPDSPVIVREPLTSLNTLLAGIGAGGTAERNLYAIADLYLAASATSKSQLLFDFKAWPLRDPATGLIYARARWYDAETGAFLTPDPVGYQDSSNLYAFCANDPVNCGDPTGSAGIKDTALSLLGWGVGVVESASETVHGLNPVVSNYRAISGAIPRARRIAVAYQSGGVSAAGSQYGAEVEDFAGGVAKGLPVVNTIRQIAAIEDAYNAGSFEGGRQVGRATFGLAGDAAFIYGGVKGVHRVRAARAPVTVYNARTTADMTQAVAKRIDPTLLNKNARFGPAVYVAEAGETAVAEVAHHGQAASHVIRYDFNLTQARVLDLSNPAIAAEWGYTSGYSYTASQAIARRAVGAGYNVVKFKSLRGPGMNYAVLNEFGELLKPQMVAPAP